MNPAKLFIPAQPNLRTSTPFDITAILSAWVKDLSHPEVWIHAGDTIFKILLIILFSRMVVWLIRGVVNRIFHARSNQTIRISQRRTETARILVNNIVSYVMYFVALLLVIDQLGFNLAPLLASAGVLGLAIGFGASKIVADLISGFFIVFEDAYAVGDTISIDKITGIVVEIGLRMTKIKGNNGEIHMIPNGRVNDITNFSIENSVALVDIPVAHQEKLEHVTSILNVVCELCEGNIEGLTHKPTLLGICQFTSNEVIYRIKADCEPLKHWAVERMIRAKVKESFEANQIQFGYPKLIVEP
jgi:moderate conductance mechanosensitive channel